MGMEFSLRQFMSTWHMMSRRLEAWRGLDTDRVGSGKHGLTTSDIRGTRVGIDMSDAFSTRFKL